MDAGCAFFVIIVLTLFAGNGFDALLMATSCKFCVEEFVEALAAYVFADETTGEDDDVGVVVLTDEVGNLWLPNKSGTDALELVEAHGDAFARTAHGDARIDFAFLDAFSQCMAVGGIVAGLFCVGAIVLVLITFLFEIFLDELLQWECCMIAGNSNCFHFHKYNDEVKNEE